MPHKYISKHKSKRGNWVYIYEEAVDKAKELNDKYGPKTTTTFYAGGTELRTGHPKGYDQKRVTVTRNLIGGRTTGRSEAYERSQFRRSASNPRVTQWSRNTETGRKDSAHRAAGDDKVRYRTTSKGVRKEYGDSRFDSKQNSLIRQQNAANRGRGFVAKMKELNDKYGPKYTTTLTSSSAHSGQVYVHEYTRNLIGGRKIKVESYSYDKD